MNKKIGGFIVLLFIAISCFSTVIVCRADDSPKEIIYSRHISKMIMSCESKDWMSHSRSQYIRSEWALHALKGSFLSANKSDLIQDMIEEDVGIKPHQMTHYLNKRFFELLRRSANYCQRRGTVATMN